MALSGRRSRPTVDDGRDGITDVPGIRVGHWTNRRAATGCTAILCPPGTIAGVDVRGAAPGTRETDVLRPGNLVEEAHAVLLSGGSAFGLDAAGGVMRYLVEQGIGFEAGDVRVPIVPAAILFDLAVGRPTWPDADAGYRAAARATSGRVAEGSVGAGTGATVAKLAGRTRAVKGGIGTASERFGSGVTVGAIAAVNAAGAIRDPRNGEFVAAPLADDGGFIDVEELIREGTASAQVTTEVTAEPTNTTLAVIATNAALTKTQATRLAVVAHDALARTTWPAHRPNDGDVIFTLATQDQAVSGAEYAAIEAIATLALERAVLRGVLRATGLAGVPAVAEL